MVIGSDHGGVALKNRVKNHLTQAGYAVNDLGVHSEEPTDYPDISKLVCGEYLTGSYSFGVLLCGTGIGVSIAANKIKGIRCAVIFDTYTADMAKSHNDANIVAFGGRVEYTVPVEEMLDVFIGAEFKGGRHSRRIDKILLLEET